MFRKIVVLSLVAGCQVEIEDQQVHALDSFVPCSPVAVAASDHHVQAHAAMTASASPPGAYLWEFADDCQGRITAGQGTQAIQFIAGSAGCTTKLTVTNAQNCTGGDRVQIDFTDVPAEHIFHTFVDRVAIHDVIGGCGLGQFCMDASTLREEMARILLRARAVVASDPDYAPPACNPSSQREFDDVSWTNPYCAWIEQLEQEHITAGCGGNNFCPSAAVSRGEMAVFLLVAKEGPSYRPPACIDGRERFLDVDNTHVFCAWIEELARRGVTGGCGGGNYCPTAPVARGQMAVFVDRTFGLMSH